MADNHQNADLGRGLRWVQGEITHSLEQVRLALAGVLDEGNPASDLAPSIATMREVASVCMVARCHGGQFFAYQMAQCLATAAHKQPGNSEAILSELVAASFQLEKYIGIVVGGIPDHPLAALDSLNTLRKLMGQEAYSPAAALAASWRMSHAVVAPTPAEGRTDANLAARAQKHLPVMKQASALILRDPKHAKAWQILAQATGQFAAVSAQRHSYGLWRLAKGIATVGARLPDQARPQVAELLRRQLSLLPHYGKAKPEIVEATAAQVLAGWVLLLLKLDRKGSLARSLLAPIGLDRDDLLPQRLPIIDEAMQKPAEDSLVAVLRALQQDLASLKDDVESLQRDSNRPNEEVDTASQRFKNLSATARGLGDEDLAETLRGLGKQFVTLSRAEPADPGWAELAVGLLKVEQGLGTGLLGSRMRAAAAKSSPMTADARSSTLRECLINLARIKTEVDALLAHGRQEHAQNAIDHVRELSGALQIFGDDTLIQPFKSLQAFMAREDFSSVMQHTGAVAAFADAVASAEYLLEALRDADPDVAAEQQRLADYVQKLDQFDGRSDAEPAAAAAKPAVAPAAQEVDEELREIFLEEVSEVLETLQRHIGPWKQAENAESLAELRRAFHTLKGSGRMVGATDIAEFGWAIENVLNHCRDGDVTRSPELIALVSEGVDALPQIIERFRNGALARELVEPTCKRADKLLGIASDDDADLLNVFVQDAEASLAILDAADSASAPAPEVVNAWHTLRGGAAAAGLSTMADCAAAAEHLHSQAALVQQAVPAGLAQQALDWFRQALAASVAGEPVTDCSELIQNLRQQAGSMLKSAPESEDDDPELRLIFCGEAQDLLESADNALAEVTPGQADPESAQQLQRIFHTVKGSARMAGATGLGQLGVDLDARAKAVIDAGNVVDADTLKYFKAATRVAWQLVDAFQAGRDDPVPAIDVNAAADAPAAPAASEPSSAHPEPEAIKPAATEPAPVATAAPSFATPQMDDAVDPELLEIFLPECDELLDELDGGLRDAQSEARPLAALDALFRALHTLKGGARMAGLLTMGESAHQLETFVEKLRTSKNDLTEDDRRRMQAGADELRGLRDRATSAPIAEDASDGETAATPTTAADAGGDAASRAAGGDTARVPVGRLDGMLTDVGEISMFRSRLEQQLVGLGGQLREFDQTIERLRDQVRNLESATDAQIQARASGVRQDDEGDRYEEDFDPLEMDRYTRMQELTRSITETISDLGSLHRSMRESVGESEAMVVQQGRLSTTMQEGLLTTLAVPFERQQGRLARVVRQAATDDGKVASLAVEGGETELDRNVLERIVPALEHILRNSVVHGIEPSAQRRAAGKADEGVVRIALRRDSNRIVLEITDDGDGLNHERIREEAIKRGLLAADTDLSEDRIAQFIFEPGFSTAKTVSLTAGRGVGMDVVAAEVRQLGGSIDVGSERGKGSRFTIRLPFSLAITQALQVQAGGEDFVVPLASISGVARVPGADLLNAAETGTPFHYSGTDFEVKQLGTLLGAPTAAIEAQGYMPVLFVRLGGDSGQGRAFAVVVDHLLGTREVVAKNVGRQVASVPGIGGASIQPDGRVVVILDLADLILDLERRGLRGAQQEAQVKTTEEPLVMVIDDSITMRRVAERVLTRSGYRVALAKDGADGVALLQTTKPDAVLLDIEMPKMDGFEVASFIRHDANLSEVPIIMITSRSGDKHRERAANIGVNGYLIKPYQERELLDELERQLNEPQALQAGT